MAWALIAAGSFACGGGKFTPPIYDGGEVPDGGVEPPDTGPIIFVPDAMPGMDAEAPPPPTVRVTGTVIKLDTYLRGQAAVAPGVEIRLLGIEATSPVTSDDPTGTYRLQVPQNGKIVVRASKVGYKSTYSELVVAAAPILGRSIYVAGDQYVNGIAAANQVDLTSETPCHPPNPVGAFCKYAIVIGRVVDDGSADNGTPTPVAGATAAEFEIKGQGDATWYKKGPYFLNYNGEPDVNVTTLSRQLDMTTGRYRGGVYVTFVEVPTSGDPGRDFEITLRSNVGGAELRQFGPVQFKAFPGGLTWVALPESTVTPPMPPPVQNVSFETQVYPLLLKVNEGGLGCLGCHTNEGGVAPSGGMNMYGGPAAAYAAINPMTYPNRTNTANPSMSLVLTKPLYEQNGVQDHPIFAFASVTDPSYQLIYQWIREGAVYVGGMPPPPVSFYNDIRPLLYRNRAQGGIGCYDCHVSGVDANTAPGGLYMGGTAQELFQELTAEAPTDDGATGEPYRINKQGNTAASLVLLNPLLGSPEPHPAKLINGANDPNYQKIYRWISEGYRNDSPP